MRVFEPEIVATLTALAASIRDGWQPGCCCRMRPRAALARVIRIKVLVARGQVEPGRALRAAQAAARAAGPMRPPGAGFGHQ